MLEFAAAHRILCVIAVQLRTIQGFDFEFSRISAMSSGFRFGCFFNVFIVFRFYK